MNKIEEIQKYIDNDCEFFDGCVTSYFEFIWEPINKTFISDLKEFYDEEAKLWFPNPKKVERFELNHINEWKKQLNVELKDFFYLSEYDREPEKYKDEIKILIQSRDNKMQGLIILIEELLINHEFEVFELNVELDGYYACYSKDYIFKTEKAFYILKAQIHD